ncbi:hypothetical protein BKA93DRAFT_794125 [Sparassis latifolia]
MNPDVCCYAEDVVDTVAANSATAGYLGYADLYIEVKRSPALDYFTDPAPDAERASHHFALSIDDECNRERGEQALGKNVACAAEACARQHRIFYFSVSLSGSHARLIRWDRAGAIASESFDLLDKPEHLCEFLWRYAHASDPERGYDPTVRPATRAEENLFKTAIERHVRQQLDLEDEALVAAAMEEHYQPSTVAAISVVDEFSPTYAVASRLLVSRPLVSPASITGRGTRGFWAVPTDGSCRVVFLKDTWRFEGASLTEGEILADLQDAGVPNIPQLVRHGDVLEQVSMSSPAHEDEDGDRDSMQNEECGDDEGSVIIGVLQYTQTDLYQDEHWVCKGGRGGPFYAHVHNRLISGTAGYGLQRFEGTQELLHAMFDVYQAMLGAFTVDEPERRRFHCDVSLGNVILFMDPDSGSKIRRGYLIDWELSCLVAETGEARDDNRTGTLPFMSRRLLKQDNATHTFQDDMESILWVVLYCSLVWLEHDQPPHIVLETVRRLFEDHMLDKNGKVTGGFGKLCNQIEQSFTANVRFASRDIQEWLDNVMRFNSCYFFYRAYDPESAETWEEPARFKEFWGEYLRTHYLPQGDRIPSQLPRTCAGDGTLPSSSAARALAALPASGVALPTPVYQTAAGRKRKAEGHPVGADVRETKRRTLLLPTPSARLTRARTREMAVEGISAVLASGGDQRSPKSLSRHSRRTSYAL